MEGWRIENTAFRLCPTPSLPEREITKNGDARHGGVISVCRPQLGLCCMKSFVFCSLMAALLLALILQGNFMQMVLVLAASIWILGPVLLFVGLWAISQQLRTHQINPGVVKTLIGTLVIAASLGISLVVGKELNHWQIQRTRDFVSEMVPRLDDFRAKQGRYPQSLNELGEIHLPALLAEPGGYRSTGSDYHFEFWDPAGLMNGYSFDSQNRQWVSFD
jgi:hypothetical protein